MKADEPNLGCCKLFQVSIQNGGVLLNFKSSVGINLSMSISVDYLEGIRNVRKAIGFVQ